MQKTVSITVTGKVQGVWFRGYTLHKALELHITGFVKNQPDHSVYIIAAGTKEQLDEFIVCCRQGSPGSKVEQVEVKEIALQQFTSFSIER